MENCDDCGNHDGEQHGIGCVNAEPTCPQCGRDYEGCECQYEPPTCSICDAIGHGYPGAGPCPLEERGADDDPRGF